MGEYHGAASLQRHLDEGRDPRTKSCPCRPRHSYSVKSRHEMQHTKIHYRWRGLQVKNNCGNIVAAGKAFPTLGNLALAALNPHSCTTCVNAYLKSMSPTLAKSSHILVSRTTSNLLGCRLSHNGVQAQLASDVPSAGISGKLPTPMQLLTFIPHLEVLHEVLQ